MGAGDGGPPLYAGGEQLGRGAGAETRQSRWWMREGVILRPTFCHTSVVSVHLRQPQGCTDKD